VERRERRRRGGVQVRGTSLSSAAPHQRRRERGNTVNTISRAGTYTQGVVRRREDAILVTCTTRVVPPSRCCAAVCILASCVVIGGRRGEQRRGEERRRVFDT